MDGARGPAYPHVFWMEMVEFDCKELWANANGESEGVGNGMVLDENGRKRTILDENGLVLVSWAHIPDIRTS